jgi:shikimate kinase
VKLVLAGFKGVGKTTCGKVVADKLQLPFFDTDELLSSRYKKPIRELHVEMKEERFREEEASVLEDLIEEKKAVIALGGGTLVNQKAQEIVSEMGCVVYLHCTLDILLQRLTPTSFLDPNDLEGSFQKLYEARHPIFCKLCQYRVDVDYRTPEEVAHTILNFYG